MRKKGRPKSTNLSRKAQVRSAQAVFRERMRALNLWSIQAYLPSALVLRIDEKKKVKESRSDYLARVLAPLHGVKLAALRKAV